MARKVIVPFGVQKRILTALKRNQEVPTPQRKSHAQIAIEHSTPDLKITIDRVRQMNARYKAKRIGRGQSVARTIPPVPGRENIPDRVKSLVQENLNITQEQVRKRLSLSSNQFATLMRQFGLNFRKLKFDERKRAIETLAFVIKRGTTRQYTNEEIARELGFTRKYVEEHRPRRGKSSGTRAQIETVIQETLMWTDLMTLPESGQITYSQLLQLTGSNPFTLSTALKELKKAKAIKEIDTSKDGLIFVPAKGERYFIIGTNGFATRNKLGQRIGTNRLISSFTLPRLEKMYDQLAFLKIHGTFKVSQRLMDSIKEARDRKRFEEFRRKNGM